MFDNKIDIDGKTYDLSYSVSKSDGGSFIFSVLKKLNTDIVDKSTVRVAPITFDCLEEIAELMCRNTVTPTCFREIAEEIIIDKIFVE